MGYAAYIHCDIMGTLFSKDAAEIAASHQYLKAYAIDCALTPFLFCFIGYFNGCERTLFVMLQGIIGAFGIRVPVVFLMSSLPCTIMIHIGLATTFSTVVQITLCLIMYSYIRKKRKVQEELKETI